jgi:hypothetical protein
MQPTSLLGSGFIEEDGDPEEQASILKPQSSMPLPMMMAPPPQAPVSPGLAGLSGMLAARQGQAGNPYLAQQQQGNNSAVEQQQGMMRTMGYMQQQQLAAQAQQLRAQAMQQRMERAKQAQQTRERELEIRTHTELLKSKSPLAQRMGDAGMRRYYKSLGIDIPEGALTFTEHEFKKEDRDHVDGLLKLLPPGTTDFSPVAGGFPAGMPPEYPGFRKKILDNEIASAVATVPKTLDPIEAEKKVSESWRTLRGYEKDDEIYQLAAKKYREMTAGQNPMFPNGREVYRSTDAERPMVERIFEQATEHVKTLRSRARVQEQADKLREKEAEKKVAKGQEVIPGPELPLLIHRETRQSATPGMTRDQVSNGPYVRVSAKDKEAIGYGDTIQEYLNKFSALIERNPGAIALSQIPGSALLSKDAAEAQTLLLAIPSIVRNFGEVGNLAEKEQARALAAAFGIASKEGYNVKIQTIVDLVNAKYKRLGIRTLSVSAPKTRTRRTRANPSPLAPEPLAPPPGGVEEN